MVVGEWDDVVDRGMEPGTGCSGAGGVVDGHGARVEGVGV